MRKVRTAAVLLASGVLTMGIAGGSAGAQGPDPKQESEQVLVFILDVAVPVTKYENPEGCHQLPMGTHVVINDTNSDITLYASPNCGEVVPSPGVPVKAGYGAHDSPAFGSFKA